MPLPRVLIGDEEANITLVDLFLEAKKPLGGRDFSL